MGEIRTELPLYGYYERDLSGNMLDLGYLESEGEGFYVGFGGNERVVFLLPNAKERYAKDKDPEYTLTLIREDRIFGDKYYIEVKEASTGKNIRREISREQYEELLRYCGLKEADEGNLITSNANKAKKLTGRRRLGDQIITDIGLSIKDIKEDQTARLRLPNKEMA